MLVSSILFIYVCVRHYIRFVYAQQKIEGLVSETEGGAAIKPYMFHTYNFTMYILMAIARQYKYKIFTSIFYQFHAKY